MLNALQSIAAKAYGDGDFAEVESVEDAKTSCLDGLFTFILLELSDVPDDAAEAIRRMERAKDDIDCVIDAICRSYLQG